MGDSTEKGNLVAALFDLDNLGGQPIGYLLGVIHFNALDNWLHLGLGSAILASGIIGAKRI